MADQLRDALRERETRGTRIGAAALMDRVDARLGQETRPILSVPSPRKVMPRWAVGLAAALAVVLVVGGTALSIWLFSGPGSREVADQPITTVTAPTTIAPETTTTVSETTTTVSAATTIPAPTEPGTVFSWGYDDLSEWVTEDEMTALLEYLSRKFYADTGGDLGGKAVLARPGGDLVWGVGYWSVGVHAGGGYHPTPTKTDPRLPAGAKYHGGDEGVSSSYGFSGPNSGQSICITLTTPGTIASNEEEPNFETIFFEVASMMLREMGWAD